MTADGPAATSALAGVKVAMPALFPLGIVIPTLNEAGRLPLLLEDLARLPFSCDIVVADGGSSDATTALAERAGARVVRSAPGRALQMNGGARALGTRWLLFLHADTRLTPEVGPALNAWLRRTEARDATDPAGAAFFKFRLEGDDRFWRFIEWGQRARERLTGLAYGDQGLLVSGADFQSVGGFQEIPIMEDVRMIRALRKRGPLERLPASLLTSTRRYEREGRWRAFFRNAALICLHGLGASPRMLAPLYRPEEASPPLRTLLVFAKAPVAGKVKTRLAATIGDEAAADLYRAMGRAVVDRVRAGAHRTVIVYDPPESGPLMVEWLGGEGIDFRPQVGGDLGSRLDAAFREALLGGGAACVIGTDVPGLDLAHIDQAFEALERCDVVVGPAEDGGYYLLGLTRPEPALFRGMAWSTANVLAETRERAARLGLREVALPKLRDVDTVADLRATSHLLEDILER